MQQQDSTIKFDENSLQIVFLKYTDKMTAHGNLSCVEIILMDITSYGLCRYHQTVKLNSMSNFLSIQIILYMLVLGSWMTLLSLQLHRYINLMGRIPTSYLNPSKLSAIQYIYYEALILKTR